MFNCSIIWLIVNSSGGFAESKCKALKASGLTKCYMLQNVELILSSAYYSRKLLLSMSYILETRGSNAIVKRGIRIKERL